ncbi:MAG: aminopeptidase N, partial [Rothia dentocariosa]|nr:aminopeptidase N [Rothia dentocariosa]
MPGLNLTRDEAIERATVIKRVHTYRIELDLPSDKDVFTCKTEIRFDAVPGASTFIDAITSTVRSIELNGEQLDTGLADGERITLPNLAAQNVLVIDADMFYTNTGEGLHRFVDPVDGEVYLYSQFEVIVRVPTPWVVVSNQPEVKIVPKDCGCGRAQTWYFKPTPRISSYITAIVAGPYEKVTSELTNSEGRVIPLGVYARK